MTQELIPMTNKDLSRHDVITRLMRQEINGTDAARILNLTVRQIRRIKARVKKHGAKGLVHGNRGKPSNHRTSDEMIQKIETIVRENYSDFGPTFAAEKLDENHQIIIGKEKLRLLMIDWGLWTPKPRKKNKQYRSWRPRKECYGEMVQFDGSYHHWFEHRAPECCLLGAIDDAAGKITGLHFVHDEGVMPVFGFWKHYTHVHGKPHSIYLDRHSTYHQNQKSVLNDPEALTQFERAMQDLDIKVIHAYSAPAKGRIERLFGTLQDRLVKEFRLAGISTITQANQFVKKVFIPKFNQQFAMAPHKKANLHKKLTAIDAKNLDTIFSRHSERVVNNDFTIRFDNQWFQLSQTQPTLVLRKDRVRIEERLDGSTHIALKGKHLNYTVLPGRPLRIKVMAPALARTPSPWKPPANHPWRRAFITAPQQRHHTSSQVSNAS